MSKYGWISDLAEHYLNQALKERIKRWTVITLPSEVVTAAGMTSTPETRERLRLELHRSKERAHKYMCSAYLRQAIWAFHNQRVQDMDGMQPRSLKGHMRMKKKAGDLKRFMKEVQRRYEIIDRAFNATIVRKGGRIDRVSKDAQAVKRSAYRRETV